MTRWDERRQERDSMRRLEFTLVVYVADRDDACRKVERNCRMFRQRIGAD